ncbi:MULTISPECIES: DEAD/DEAH box helicase [Rhodococcus]|uniref:DEAD/DEAH box helicase n=1 Tax=Rhodococcus sp. MS13 TaxID=2579940 RepID=UPI000B9CEBB8|nr:DEAD/DEAH box helicase [Rhodococcus sp. MS13]OXM17768.1 helicase [Rhodococcus erythropolis]
MQPDSVRALDLDRIRAVVGTTTYERGLTYLRQNAVESIAWNDTADTLTGAVSGTAREPYTCTISVSRSAAGTATFTRGLCTCPVRMNCKHVVALVLAAVAEANKTPQHLGWDSALEELLRPDPAGRTTRGLGIQFTTRTKGASTRLIIKPVQPGARGWISGGLAWNKLGSTFQFPADHLRVLRDIHLLHSAGNYYRNQNAAEIDLAGFASPQLWSLLREAITVGVSLVHSKAGLGNISLLDDASICLDVHGAEDNNLRLTPRIQAGGHIVTHTDWGLVGTPAHGVFALDAANAITLAPLHTPITHQLRQLIDSGKSVDIPAEHRDAFTSRFVFKLGNLAPVISSDGAYNPPTVSGPRLQLVATYADNHRIDIESAWKYTVDADELIISTADTTTDESEIRNHVAEDAIAKSLGAAAAKATLAGTLAGLDSMQFTLDLLPQLASHDEVDLTVAGTPADYRPADDAVVIGLSTSAPDGSSGSDWFDLDVTVDVAGQSVPFTTLFSALSKGETHILLPDGAFFRLDAPDLLGLHRLITEARSLLDRPTGKLAISKFQAGLWEELTTLGRVEHQAAAWKKQIAGLLGGSGIDPVDVPATLTATLRPYQVDGFRWLNFLRQHSLGGILADDMGLGKTLQTLAMICTARQSNPAAPPFLIVAPTSVVSNWKSEVAKFAPTLHTAVITDTLRRRRTDLATLVDGADIVVTSYALFRLDTDAYSAGVWSGLVLDEAQFAKNHKSKVHKCATAVNAPFKLAITGTPMENNLMELWSLLAITAPGLFPSPTTFTDVYRNPIEKEGDTERLAQLRRRVKPLMVRRTKEQVAADLPPKQEQILEIELHPSHRAIYDTHLQRERQKILGLLDDVDKNRFTILQSLTVLRQLSLDVSLVDEESGPVPSAKVDALVEQLDDVIAGGHRALIFSQFTGFLGSVRKRLEAEKIPYSYLDGSTRNRGEVLEEFKSGVAPVFMISLKAGGFGLNLTEADYCFILDPWWNPAAEAQAVDRTHRIGQTRNVMVYRLIAKDTIEEKVMALKAKKSALFSNVMDAEGTLGTGLDAEDLRALFE